MTVALAVVTAVDRRGSWAMCVQGIRCSSSQCHLHLTVLFRLCFSRYPGADVVLNNCILIFFFVSFILRLNIYLIKVEFNHMNENDVF